MFHWLLTFVPHGFAPGDNDVIDLAFVSACRDNAFTALEYSVTVLGHGMFYDVLSLVDLF